MCHRGTVRADHPAAVSREAPRVPHPLAPLVMLVVLALLLGEWWSYSSKGRHGLGMLSAWLRTRGWRLPTRSSRTR